mmetsp:Transcript_32864/g.36898  ORF Transcript_32864/g.36898 Transcript_32864/m.36898 type:complete len:205 (+) Transcript_32864:264-878(+)
MNKKKRSSSRTTTTIIIRSTKRKRKSPIQKQQQQQQVQIRRTITTTTILMTTTTTTTTIIMTMIMAMIIIIMTILKTFDRGAAIPGGLESQASLFGGGDFARTGHLLRHADGPNSVSGHVPAPRGDGQRPRDGQDEGQPGMQGALQERNLSTGGERAGPGLFGSGAYVPPRHSGECLSKGGNCPVQAGQRGGAHQGDISSLAAQ